MPLRGKGHSDVVGDDAPFFRTLAALDEWADSAGAGRVSTGVLPYKPRSATVGPDQQKGKLLLCHDYKGGYTEKPSSLAYTFNFWHLCDTFIYFAHHRVTVPPSGWTTAAHRQGVRMLGTLIFEHEESQPDGLQLLFGRLPPSTTGPACPPASTSTVWPVSRHYARILADLAYQRGFDGYLLNVEIPLEGGAAQCLALSRWIALLESELRARIGEHAQVIWYDSVVIKGDLSWQDRLNSFNLPFFLSSTGFFTNYTWPPHYPSLTAQYFLSLQPEHTVALGKTRQLRDIFVGVDVWGRGQHGGGGLGCYKAIDHIDPKSLRLSVALFGHGWTWESQQDEPGWNWETWWAYERLFWVGPENDGKVPIVKDVPDREGVVCTQEHGPYQPISSFFERHSPPNPLALPFFTTFSPGVGCAWFVNGVKVWEAEEGSLGWTDLDKNNSLGNMVWPKPSVYWHNMDRTDVLPTPLSSLDMRDAWLGGSALRLSMSLAITDTDDAFFRCVWVPVQSLAITPRKTYTASIVFKTDDALDQSAGADVALACKTLEGGAGHQIEIDYRSDTESLDSGWQQLSIHFSVSSATEDDVHVAAGLVLRLVVAEPSEPASLSVLLGSLTVHPTTPAWQTTLYPRVMWMDFQPSADRGSGLAESFTGVLTWEVGGHHGGDAPTISIESPDDPVPAWVASSPLPLFQYFNIYVLAPKPGEAALPQDATFIGTTGLSGHANRFYVDKKCLPTFPEGTRSVRFYTQGLTSDGKLIPWEDCAFVDVGERPA